MSKIYEIKNVPESELNVQEQILIQDGATEVRHEKQDDGLYTIIATYPD